MSYSIYSMSQASDFFQTYLPYIILVIVVIISSLVMFSILGVTFNDNNREQQQLTKSVSFYTNI